MSNPLIFGEPREASPDRAAAKPPHANRSTLANGLFGIRYFPEEAAADEPDEGAEPLPKNLS